MSKSSALQKLGNFPANYRIQYIMIFLGVLASRMPFINAGFGSDNDSWDVANAAMQMRSTFSYVASRAPGFPVHEILASFLIAAGPLATNLLSAVFSAIGVVSLLRILHRVKAQNAALFAVCLGCVPPFYLASTSTIDFPISLAFQLLSFQAMLGGRVALSGSLLGVATGTRLSSLSLLVALIFLVRRRGGGTLKLVISTFASGIVCYSPYLATYGLEGIHAYPPEEWLGFDVALFNGILWPLGIFGSIGILIAATALFLPQFRAAKSLSPADRDLFIAALLAILPQIGLFIAMPVEPGYLISIYPFILLLAAINLDHITRLVVAFLILISPWANLSSNGLIAGPLLVDYQRRQNRQDQVSSWIQIAQHFTTPTAIVVGPYYPMICYQAKGAKDGFTTVGATRFYWRLPKQAVAELRSVGTTLYVLEQISRNESEKREYDFFTEGFELLPAADIDRLKRADGPIH